jgi:hypothetical protein
VQHDARQPAVAHVGVDEGIEEVLDGHGHGLARGHRERAAGPDAGSAQPPDLLVLDDVLLGPPVADVMFAREPVGDLTVRTAGSHPRRRAL